jgi:hypothetical protein
MDQLAHCGKLSRRVFDPHDLTQRVFGEAGSLREFLDFRRQREQRDELTHTAIRHSVLFSNAPFCFTLPDAWLSGENFLNPVRHRAREFNRGKVRSKDILSNASAQQARRSTILFHDECRDMLK